MSVACAQDQLRIHAANLELTVSQRTADLRTTVQELEAFSYSIAHDMRAPLRAMQGFAKLLTEEHGAQLNDIGKGFLKRLWVSAGRLDEQPAAIIDTPMTREDIRDMKGVLCPKRILTGRTPSLRSELAPASRVERANRTGRWHIGLCHGLGAKSPLARKPAAGSVWILVDARLHAPLARVRSATPLNFIPHATRAQGSGFGVDSAPC